MQLPQIVEQNGVRVLTTRQLTEWYKTEEWQIKQNFRNNKERFVLGKHYITLQGEELKGFKSKVENIYLVGKTAKILYLWTEKGALLHAKSLNTDKAWEVYDYLVDFYFRAKESGKKPGVPQTYREKREAALAEQKAKEATVSTESIPERGGFDIAPLFRQLIQLLPIEALDEMEKSFRRSDARAVKLAAISILSEKMKRQIS